jgi:hypothetical protein
MRNHEAFCIRKAGVLCRNQSGIRQGRIGAPFAICCNPYLIKLRISGQKTDPIAEKMNEKKIT